MKHTFFYLLVACLLISTVSTSAKTDFHASVKVKSVYARRLPSPDAPETASLFKDETLEAVSRNLDGTWFEMRRPGRMNNLGWVFGEMLEWDFAAEQLPLGDISTGLIGSSALLSAPDFAIYLNESPTLRTQPLRKSPRVPASPSIPLGTTLPIIARNQDGSWLYVNYLGYQGWIVAFVGRVNGNPLQISQAVDLPPLENIPTQIIPVELQQAQIDRLTTFITNRRAYAVSLESFWWRVYRGEIMPCDPPPELLNYPYTENDVRELPELQRYAPRLTTAIEYLQASQSPLSNCGVVSPDRVIDARNSAINARVIFDATLDQLETLEHDVVQTRR